MEERLLLLKVSAFCNTPCSERLEGAKESGEVLVSRNRASYYTMQCNTVKMANEQNKHQYEAF